MSLISKFSQIINNGINLTKKSTASTKPIIIKTGSEEDDEKLLGSLDALSNIKSGIIHVNSPKILEPDIEYLKSIVNQYSRSESGIVEDTEKIKRHLNLISGNLESAALSASSDEIADILASKAVVDFVANNVRYNQDFIEGNVGFVFGFPTGEISRLANFEEEFAKSTELFKQEGILDLSQYDLKKHQFDAEQIMQKYDKKTHHINACKYDELFNPIARLKKSFYQDPYLNSNANFYRIISSGELIELFKTKRTGKYIDANGYYTNGHYSCITTNPNYNEQAFINNGIPIRLKFKTKDSDGQYNMDLLDRISCIKPERSIYRVYGYNYYDIDWDNFYVSNGIDWTLFPRKDIEELEKQAIN